MANFFNSFLQQIATGDQIKDYQHAARTFIDGVYRLSPKISSLYHVFIDVNTSVANITRENQIEMGMLAKAVQLPKFSVQTKTLNAYNRKNINQERINYDPVSITFHDDSANVVRNFWHSYYTYYYRDIDHQLTVYNQEHKYKLRQAQNWGLGPQRDRTINYISSIRIYSLHQKYFSSYILINPTITSFQHGEHTSGEYSPLEHSMTVAYEAVQYETGPVSNNTVLGFSEIHYDQSPSPLTSIGGGTRSILGPGGLVEGAGDFVTNLSNGNFIGAALGGIRTANNFRNTDFRSALTAEMSQTARNILSGQNPTSRVFFPTTSSVRDALTKPIFAVPGVGSVTAGDLGIAGQNANLPNSNQRRIIT